FARPFSVVAAVSDRRSHGDLRSPNSKRRPPIAECRTAVGDRRYRTDTMKPRLTRLKWLYTQTPVYFLTPCTEDRLRVLANEEIHREFIAFANEATRRH